MKYFVTTTGKGDKNKITRIVEGDYVKGKRVAIYIEDHEIDPSFEPFVDLLYRNPIKTLRAAKMHCTRLSKAYPHLTIGIKEYPDEVSASQFGAFIRW